MINQQLYSPVVIAANATYTNYNANGVGGFLCTVSGTLTVVNKTALQGVDQSATLLNALAVTAGTFYPLNWRMQGIVVTLAGGAAGVLQLV